MFIAISILPSHQTTTTVRGHVPGRPTRLHVRVARYVRKPEFCKVPETLELGYSRVSGSGADVDSGSVDRARRPSW